MQYYIHYNLGNIYKQFLFNNIYLYNTHTV